jgi:hypothetical protein
MWDHISPSRLIGTDGRQWTVNYGLAGGVLEAELKDPPPSTPDFVPLDWLVSE